VTGTYNTGITRGGGGASPDALVPQPVSTQIIEELPEHSALLTMARHVTMSALTDRMPVLSALPVAYWVTGDQGLKQTADQQWRNVILTAEELACIVPIPQAYLDDADVPIWDEVRPRVAEALGLMIDGAGIFGVNAPTSWQTYGSVYSSAIAAGNQVIPGTTDDLGTDIARLGVDLRKQGYRLSGFASAPGFTWNLTGYRNPQGYPIYVPGGDAIDNGPAGRLYGYALNELGNGAWNADDAALIAGDWSHAILGLRQDITFEVFTEGVISDDTGKVILNLMQQDSVALRVVMRVGFALANPVTALSQAKGLTNISPFAVLGEVAALT
jgi:HK97 family phage major capsid protein